jgi:hypothetical protein
VSAAISHSCAVQATTSATHSPPPLISTASVPEEFLCPIAAEIMDDPVVTGDGQTYERAAVEKWLINSHLSPLTGKRLDHKLLIPNVLVRRQIREFRERHCASLSRPTFGRAVRRWWLRTKIATRRWMPSAVALGQACCCCLLAVVRFASRPVARWARWAARRLGPARWISKRKARNKRQSDPPKLTPVAGIRSGTGRAHRAR